MEFSSKNDLELILKLDNHGRPLRVKDCVRFGVRVWTQNRNNFLFFGEKEITVGEHHDRIIIPEYYMSTLESGVVQYEYSYSLDDVRFKPFHGHDTHNHQHHVVTDIYWKNCNFNQVPSNPVNFQTLCHLRELIEQETAEREYAIVDLRNYFNESYINKLNEEIKRANEVDVELFNRIKADEQATADQFAEVNSRLDEEIKRSNEVDIELHNLIKSKDDKVDDIKDETDKKIEGTNTAVADEQKRAEDAEKALDDKIKEEADRAKDAERELNTAVLDEVSRAKTKEAELDGKVSAETQRATIVENALTTSVNAAVAQANQIAADLAAEVSRSNQLDNQHTAALNDETTRAKAAEKAITDRLDVVEGDKDTVGSIAHSLEDAKHYADDKLTDVNNDINGLANDVQAIEDRVGKAEDNIEALGEKTDTLRSDLDAEVGRATAAEDFLSSRIDTIKGDKNTVGSIEHALEDAKHYADDEVSKASTALANDLAAEVSRAQVKETELQNALDIVNGDADTIGSIAHGVQDANHYTDDRLASYKAEANQTLADTTKDFATRDEVDDRIQGIIGTAPAALDTLGEIADRLGEDNDAIKAINGILSGKADADKVYTKTESDAQHTAIETEISKVDAKAEQNKTDIAAANAKIADVTAKATANETAINAEANRAKAAEGDLSNSVNAVDAKVDAVKETADKAKADLASLTEKVTANTSAISAEADRAKGVEADLANKVKANTDNIVRNANDLATVHADLETLGTNVSTVKADLAQVDSDLDAEVSRATTKEDALAKRIDTIDKTLSDIGDDLTDVTAKATDNAAAINAEVSRAKGEEAALSTAIASEVSRATTKEGEFQTALDIINGDKDTLGSIAHAVEDSKHYTDDEIAKIGTQIVGFATKQEVANVDAKVDALKGRVDNIDIDAYTKAEVDEMIANVDVTEQLADYAKTSETTVIKDENGNIITEMVIDNSEADDTIEVYTKQQCDERFALKGEAGTGGGEVDLSGYYTKEEVDAFVEDIIDNRLSNKANSNEVYTAQAIDEAFYKKYEVDEMMANVPKFLKLTQAEYDALSVKDSNTLYIVKG